MQRLPKDPQNGESLDSTPAVSLTIITSTPITKSYCDVRHRYPEYKRLSESRLKPKPEVPKAEDLAYEINFKRAKPNKEANNPLCSSEWPDRDATLDEKRKAELESIASGLLVQEKCLRVLSRSVSSPAMHTKDGAATPAIKVTEQSSHTSSLGSMVIASKAKVLENEVKLGWKLSRSEYRKLENLNRQEYRLQQLNKLKMTREAQKKQTKIRLKKDETALKTKRMLRDAAWERECSFYRALNADKRRARFESAIKHREMRKLHHST